MDEQCTKLIKQECFMCDGAGEIYNAVNKVYFLCEACNGTGVTLISLQL